MSRSQSASTCCQMPKSPTGTALRRIRIAAVPGRARVPDVPFVEESPCSPHSSPPSAAPKTAATESSYNKRSRGRASRTEPTGALTSAITMMERMSSASELQSFLHSHIATEVEVFVSVQIRSIMETAKLGKTSTQPQSKPLYERRFSRSSRAGRQ